MSSPGPTLVYLLCMATSLTCAALLVRSYLRDRSRLLLWTSIGFAGLALNNLALVIDLILLPAVDLWICRQIAIALSLVVLIYGFLWETSR